MSAILLLIPYHAARFLQKGDGHSQILDSGVWFVHSWHMPLFFAISGYLAAQALHRSSVVGQIRGRLRRLGLPLLVGMISIVPLANLAVLGAAALRPRRDQLPADRAIDLGNVFTLTPRHLWFLIYLLVTSIAVLGIWALLRRVPRLRSLARRSFSALLRSWLTIPLLSLMSAAILSAGSGWVAGNGSNSLLPDPLLLAYLGSFFLFGWLLAGQPELMRRIERWPWLRAGAGMALAIPAVLLFYNSADFTGTSGVSGALGEIPELRYASLIAVSLVSWLTLFGIWGLMARYVRSESSVLRYLSDASFWIFLIHIPFLVALQSALSETSLDVPVRYALTVAGTLGLSVASYALFVRRTPVGTFLQGRRPRPRPAAAPA